MRISDWSSDVCSSDLTLLLAMMRASLTSGTSRALLEQAALTLLDYIEAQPDGFRILVRDSPMASQGASFQSIIGDTASRVEGILVDQFTKRGREARTAPN